MPADCRIVYNAQGEGFDAAVLDMALPPGMKPEIHWLANYVMLSRVRSIDGLLILRLASREQLTIGAPDYLKEEAARLAALEKNSLRELRARLWKLK